ncbi:MAG: hydroxyacid dehydrogenase [Chloroflexota bacterium]
MPKPHLLFAFNARVRENYIGTDGLERLKHFASWQWFDCNGGGIYDYNPDQATRQELSQLLPKVDGLVLCHGAPRIDEELLAMAPNLRFIGELEGDRFASRIDLDAAWARNIRVVDTTNASSYPVAEWALGLILISLRNAGGHFRRLIHGDTRVDPLTRDLGGGMLSGKRVGLIGCGHMGRLLIKLLHPFETELWVTDPYLPSEMAEALGFLQTSMENLLSQCDVIVCLAPLTPQTHGLLGKEELDQIQPGTVLVNVSRGPVIDSSALIERLRQGDIVAGLDVFDPEPIPSNSEILQLPNVFLSPHIGYYNGGDSTHFFALMVDELARFFQGHRTHFDLTPRSQSNRTAE